MRLSYTPPPGWDFATVGDLAQPEKGSIRIGPFGSALKKHEYSENGIRVLGIEDVHPNQFLSDRCKYIPDAKFCELRQYEVSDGDVLVTNMGTVGRACAVPAGTQRSIISSHLIKVSLNRSRADPTYLCWMLNYSPLVVAQIRAKSHGAIMAGFNSSLLKSLRIPLPPLAEQKRIAGILDAADALRAKRREALAQLDALLQSTFLDMFGDPVTNPMKWDTSALGEVGEVITGNTPSRKRPEYYGEDIEWIKSDNINDPSFVLTEAEERLSVAGKAVARTSPKGSILVTCIAGSPSCIGNAAIADREVAFNQQINAFLPGERIALWFAFGVFWVGKRLVQSASTNSMKGMVSKSAFSGIFVPIPPTSLQRRFAAIAESVERQKASQRAHLAELDTLFASLQSRAFRGDL